MELDELKEAWIAMDNRLKRNEELKESIILEMMQSKTGKLVNWFIAWEMFSVVVVILIIPVCFYWFDRSGGKYLVADICVLFGAAICFVYSFWGVFKIHGLMKFDFTKIISNNIFYVNRYNIQLKREQKIFSFVWPVLASLLVLSYASMKVKLSLWALLICALVVATLVSYWSYKKSHKNIDSILKSLDEIRELKEDE